MNFGNYRKYFIENQIFIQVVLAVWAVRNLWIGLYGVDVPFWDQYDGEARDLYLPLLNKNFDIRVLFGQHNEHRIFFTRILNIIIFKLNGYWNTQLVMQIQALIPSFTAGFIAQLVWNRTSSLFLLISLTLYFAAPIGTENMFWGFQSQFYFMVLFSIIALYYFALSEQNNSNLYRSFFFAIFAFFNIASGALAAIVISFLCMVKILMGASGKTQKLILVSVCFLFLFVLEVFFTNLPSGHAGMRATNVVTFIKSLYYYLSWPHIKFIPIGLGFLIATLFGLGYTLKFKKEKIKDPYFFWILSCLIWLYAQTFLLVFGRGSQGSEAQIANRYLDILFLSPLFTLLLIFDLFEGETKKQYMSFLVLIVAIVCFFYTTKIGHIQRVAQMLERERNLLVIVKARKMEVNKTGSALEYLATKAPVTELPYPDFKRLHALLIDPKFDSLLPLTRFRD